MPYVKVHHEVDPKQKILDELGDIDGKIRLCNDLVAVVVYQRPNIAMLGDKKLILADETVKEDVYQSKVGLIVAMGPKAFRKSDKWPFCGDDHEFKLHDWVVLPPSAASSMMINGVLCRVFEDTLIKAWAFDPDYVY